MDSLLRPLPPSHRPVTSSFPKKHGLTPVKVSSFRTTPAGFINFSGKLLLGPSLFPQGSPFPTKHTSSFSLVSSTLSTRRLVKAAQESEGGNGNAHFLKRHAGKVAVVLVGSLVLLFARLSGKPGLWSDKAAKTSSLPASERRDEDEVVDGYLRVLERNPRDVEALKMVLYGKMRSGRTKEAVEYVEKLIEVEPDEVEWRLLQAVCYELVGHLTKAKRLFNEILRERPLLIKALHGLSMVMHKNHEGPAVFDMLNGALELARREQRVTEERNIRILIGQMHLVQGDLDEALKQFQDLVNEDPRDFRPYLCQGIIYSLQDKKKEAEEQFENYRSFVPEEFPNRGFLDDVVLTAKTESIRQLQKEFTDEFSYRK